METFNQIFDISLVIRVLSSVLLGFAIGLEREMTNKYAGLRTNILVCLGACLFTIISIYGFPEVSVTGDELGTRDTARVAAQVVTGIGFIGGGTVLRHGATVFGLTTAATLWVSASIGMACGAGMYGNYCNGSFNSCSCFCKTFREKCSCFQYKKYKTFEDEYFLP